MVQAHIVSVSFLREIVLMLVVVQLKSCQFQVVFDHSIKVFPTVWFFFFLHLTSIVRTKKNVGSTRKPPLALSV